MPKAEPPVSLTVRAAIARVVILSFLFYGAIWAGRMYRAERHLYIVNKHRALALSTFETFVGGVHEQAIKDAVLLEATRCIFGPSPSGYLGRDEDISASRTIEVARASFGESKTTSQ